MPLIDNNDEVHARLVAIMRLAALPGASRCVYRLEYQTGGETAALRSYDATGTAIGDDRPYDILKARFEPLRKLADRLLAANGVEGTGPGYVLEVQLDLVAKRLTVIGDGVTLVDDPLQPDGHN